MKIVKVSKTSTYYQDVLNMLYDFNLEEYIRTGNDVSSFCFDKSEVDKNLSNANPKINIVVGLADGEIVGFSLFSPRNFCAVFGKKALLMEDLYIKPQFRSRGLGKEFIKYLVEVCRKKGFDRIEWWVEGSNKSTIAFYESIGAKVVENVGKSMFLDEKIMKRI